MNVGKLPLSGYVDAIVLELRKFCPYCYKHTIHGEIKEIDRTEHSPYKGGGKWFYIVYNNVYKWQI